MPMGEQPSPPAADCVSPFTECILKANKFNQETYNAVAVDYIIVLSTGTEFSNITENGANIAGAASTDLPSTTIYQRGDVIYSQLDSAGFSSITMVAGDVMFILR